MKFSAKFKLFEKKAKKNYLDGKVAEFSPSYKSVRRIFNYWCAKNPKNFTFLKDDEDFFEIMTPEQNTIRGRYKIIKELARGGMGAVFLAKDLLKNREVALKTSFFAGESKAQKAFEHEAKLLARLEHPGLPKVRDYIFEENNFQALVMDFVPGETLQDIFDSGKYRIGRGLDCGKVVDWAVQILDILVYLHSFTPPVVHRDIKPNNLKLTPEGKVILLDFGLAKGFAVSMVGGRSGYSALEQMNGSGTDPRSDIYALGATLYQLLTNDYPLTALDRFREIYGETIRPKEGVSTEILIKSDPQMPAATANPNIPPKISEIVMKAMSLMPKDRFQTAAEMKFALQIAWQKSLGDSIIGYEERIGAATNVDNLNKYAGGSSLFDDNEDSLGFQDFPGKNDFDKNDDSQSSRLEDNVFGKKPTQYLSPTIYVSDSQNSANSQNSTNRQVFPGTVFDPTKTTLPNELTTSPEIPHLPPKTPARKFGNQFLPLILGGILLAFAVSGGILAWQFGFLASENKEEVAAKTPIVIPPKQNVIEVSTYLVDKKDKEILANENYLFQEKEEFRFGVKTSQNCFLYIVSKDSDDKVNRVFPKDKKANNAIRQNTEYRFPESGLTHSLAQNSPTTTWAYFIFVPNYENELARKIMKNLNYDTDKKMSALEVQELITELDKLAENSATNQPIAPEQNPQIRIVKMAKK